jgi:hypothetical protein
MWDPGIDSWARAEDWRQLAEANVKEPYPRPDAQLILIELGDRSVESAFIQRLRVTEPDHEVSDQEIDMVWRLRRQIPELAAKWFNPESYDDVPFAEVRAKLGDPIAVQYILAGEEDDLEAREASVPHILAKLPPEFVTLIAGEDNVEAWRKAAGRWAEETADWRYAQADILAAAANMKWPEVATKLMNNPYLLPALLRPESDVPGINWASNLLLPWSRLAPSELLMKVIGSFLGTDLYALAEPHARRAMGSEDYAAKHPDSIVYIAKQWSTTLGVALAISWQRCRRSLPDTFDK